MEMLDTSTKVFPSNLEGFSSFSLSHSLEKKALDQFARQTLDGFPIIFLTGFFLIIFFPAERVRQDFLKEKRAARAVKKRFS